MKKILLTWYSKAQGGAEGSIIDLCNKISESEKFEVVLLFVNSPNFKPDLSNIDNKVIVYSLNLNLWLYERLSFFITLFILLRRKIDILHCGYRGIFGESLAAKILGKFVLSTMRAIPLEISNAKKFKYVNLFVAVSNSVMDRLRVLGYSGPIVIVHNGININNFDCSFNNDVNIKKNFYFMARLVSWKRPDWFILSAIVMHKKFPETMFHIFGDGPERENLERLIFKNRANSYIRTYGWISANDSRLTDMGICVVPSYLEPFGKTTVEAVLMNKIVVGTNSGATPEILDNYNLLFEMDSLNNLILKMERAYLKYEYYFKNISKRRNIFMRYYSMERVKKDYLQIYEKIGQ